MSLQFVDKARFELNEIDSMFNSIGLNTSSPTTTTTTPTPTTTTTSSSSTTQQPSSIQSESKIIIKSSTKTKPKTPSNLVKTSIPSFSTSSTFQQANTDLMLYDRKQLMDFLTERQENLLKTRSEYEIQFENFFNLAKKFNLEKLNNLKLTFKNQILKQQIYFETELLDLCKEYNKDYECIGKTKLNSSSKSNKRTNNVNQLRLEQEIMLVRQFKNDMKKLIDYMRESLLNSSDTLIEAYETCQTLKGLEHMENNFQKQNSQMKSTTSVLIKSLERTNNTNNNNKEEEEEEEEGINFEKQLNDEQLQFDKYKQEMDELMHILDDIELQHLQRKDQLATKTKFCNKLKSKFKFIENKYDTLNKQISNLKYESYVFKELHSEKKRSQFKSLSGSLNDSCSLLLSSSSSTNHKQQLINDMENNFEFNSKSSADSSLSPTTSLSKSSSTSSLSDIMISSSNDTNSNNIVGEVSSSEVSTTSSSSSSSSSSLCNQDISDLMNGSSHLDYENSDDSNEYDNNRSYLSLTDYNRKLTLINELINLHKSKMSTKELWSMSSNTNESSAANFIKANIKCFNLKEEENFINNNNNNNDLFHNNKLDNYTILETISNNNNNNNNIQLTSYSSNRLKQASSLDLTDCSTDGDRVIVENCNLKSDRDISNWYITRQIENMSINKYQLPHGSVIKSGKVLKIETPFANDQLDYLIAIKNKYKSERTSKFQLKKLCLKIRTKLISPDGTLKAIHIQEIPRFYQDIFKYANMIQFL